MRKIQTVRFWFIRNKGTIWYPSSFLQLNKMSTDILLEKKQQSVLSIKKISLKKKLTCIHFLAISLLKKTDGKTQIENTVKIWSLALIKISIETLMGELPEEVLEDFRCVCKKNFIHVWEFWQFWPFKFLPPGINARCDTWSAFLGPILSIEPLMEQSPAVLSKNSRFELSVQNFSVWTFSRFCSIGFPMQGCKELSPRHSVKLPIQTLMEEF